MLLLFYHMPAGLNLYIMSSSLFGTIEQYRIRKHIKQREADGTLHKPPPSAAAAPAGASRGPTKPRNPSFWQRLQAKAEEAQRVQTRAKGKARR